MQCFLDTNVFGRLLTDVDHKNLPPEILSEFLLSPVTALESAQHTPKLRIMREHTTYLRPLRHRSIANPETYDDFIRSLATETPDFYRGMLNAIHANCVMHGPFLKFHLARYGKNAPKGIAGSKRYLSDVRDSMQLVISRDLPFVTADRDLQKKLPAALGCQVFYCDLDVGCILGTISILKRDALTADKWL
jgi:hypothetical protein